MKRGKSDTKLDKFVSISRQKSIQILIVVGVLYVLLVTLEIPFVFNSVLTSLSDDPSSGSATSIALSRPSELHQTQETLHDKHAPVRWVSGNSPQPSQATPSLETQIQNSDKKSTILSNLKFYSETFDPTKKDGSVELHKSAKTAWEVGRNVWEEVKEAKVDFLELINADNVSVPCPRSISLSGAEFLRGGKNLVELPCGLTLGSHVTIVGKPRKAHAENAPRIVLLRDGEEAAMVSQFMVELQGLKVVEGEDPPRILHFNPRLKGDWSGKPVIEQNTCYRMQWGTGLRCEGWKSKADEETDNVSVPCPRSISLSGAEFLRGGKNLVELPCGLTLGSHVTIVGKPRKAHAENAPRIVLLRDGEEAAMVSQFMVELQGLKVVEGEDPPRILHFNPRLKGDWSGKPVIEQNTCYRMQWGTGLRCEGWKSKADEETVDGQVKCEKWIRDNNDRSEDSNAAWWLSRLIRRTKPVSFDWQYPFAEEKLFVLTLSAGLEGFHVNVDGRHVTSFPYRTGYTLEDATGLTVNGDIDVHSIFAGSLPSTHPSSSHQRHLEMSGKWRAPPLPDRPAELFIGVLSAGNHFAERMAVRKSWMQHRLIKSSDVVARFFVALHARKEVNLELKKEAEFFGDIVIVPYMDNYDLVVLKTVAICEYGVRTVRAKYIMKGDDDTFVKVDAILNEAMKVPEGRSLYIGNVNYYHKPLRYGKWAVTHEEWPEEDYPPYANGPGYILSSDIANFIVSEFETHRLRLFKMEDVSMGMWVEQFNSSKPVEYVHSLMFCQFGCVEGYFTAHYQSPRQMICLWNKLQHQEKPQCCNMR